MKLRELIEKVDRSESNSAYVDFETVAGYFDICGMEDGDEWDERVKMYWLAKWYCTDTYVGMAVIFFDNQPVGIFSQSARKADKNIEFINNPELIDKLKLFCLHCCERELPYIEDEDSEEGSFYRVNYANELCCDHGFYKGKHVIILRNVKNDFVSEDIEVSFEDGATKVIPVNELDIPYCLSH